MPCRRAGPALIAAAALALGACASGPAAPTRSAIVFSTRLDITVHHEDRAQADAAIDEFIAHAESLDRRFHAWKDGPLKDLNRAIAEGRLPRRVDEDTERLIALSIRMNRETQGMFNPALGKLFGMWGFHTDDPSARAATQEEIDAYMADAPPMESLVVRNGRLVEAHPNAQLDFGGILKGYSLDAARDIFAAHGIGSALVSYGSAVLAIGTPPGRERWEIGLRLGQGARMFDSFLLKGGETLATSGTAERSYEDDDGETVHHIFSQETGRSSSEVGFAAVVCDSRCGPNPSAVTDALSTAMVVGSPEDAERVNLSMGTIQHLVVDRKGTVTIGVGKDGGRLGFRQ